MRKISSFTLLAGSLLLAACTSGNGGSTSSQGNSVDVIEIPSSTSATASTPSGQARVITINVTNWSFSPADFTAKKDERVQLKLVGGEGIHGYGIPALGINARVEAGKTVTVDLPTDTVGTFKVMCTIPCGSGHQNMKGSVVISE